MHHVGAGCFGGSLHDIAARWATGAAPQSLTAHGNGFGFLAWLRAKAFQDLNWNFLLGEAFDFHHETFFVQAHQADRFATGAGTTCAANAVHVVFRHVWNFVVHHVWQVFNVNAACRNVGGHQGANVAALKASQRLSTCCLTFVAVQGHGLDAVLGEVVGHIVGTKLGAREHQHLAPVVLIDDVHQNFFFLAATHGVDHLRNALHRRVAGRDLNALGVLQERSGQVANFIAEGGGEQQALFVFGHQGQDFFHVMNKAHVEHSVGFVQHQNFNAGQIEQALALQVKQATRCGHQHVDAAFDAIDLRLHAHATKHHGGLEAEVFTVVFHGLFNLGRQFTSRCEHQSADGFAAKFVATRFRQAELVQDRQGKGCSFAGAGLSTCQQVVPCQDDRNRLGLDGRRCVVALLLHGLQNGRSQIQFFKCHDFAPKKAHGIGLSGCWVTAASQRPMGFTGGHGNHRREPGSNPSRSADVAATGGGNVSIVA